eukprot:4751760-Pleurochrysis_carterae.AAC.2
MEVNQIPSEGPSLSHQPTSTVYRLGSTVSGTRDHYGRVVIRDVATRPMRNTHTCTCIQRTCVHHTHMHMYAHTCAATLKQSSTLGLASQHHHTRLDINSSKPSVRCAYLIALPEPLLQQGKDQLL